MNKYIAVVCTFIVLIGLLIAFHLVLQKSSTVEKVKLDSELQSDLPTFSNLETLNNTYSFCRTPSCVVATSKLHVSSFVLFIEISSSSFFHSTATIRSKCKSL